MPSLTQKEEPSILRRLSNVFLFLYMRDFEGRQHQFLRGAITYIWYFSQMTGLLVVCSKKLVPNDGTEVIYSHWNRAMVYTRFNPMLSAFSTGFAITAFYMTLLACLDICFVISFVGLSRSSTKIHENNFKKWQSRITFVGTYVDYFKWFYLTLKSELIFARFLCVANSSTGATSTSMLCTYLPEFDSESGSIQSALLDVLSITNMITLIICCPLVFTVNHSPEFTASNPLKTRYSEMKLLEYALIIFSQYFAFLNDTSFAFIVINMKVAYYIAEYIYFYPLYRSDLSSIYIKVLAIFGFGATLLTIREFTSYLQDDFHLEILFVGAAFLCGVVTMVTQLIRSEIRAISLSDVSLVARPNVVCEYFQEILSLYELHKQADLTARLALHGILTTHQSCCCDKLCPCQISLVTDQQSTSVDPKEQQGEKASAANGKQGAAEKKFQQQQKRRRSRADPNTRALGVTEDIEAGRRASQKKQSHKYLTPQQQSQQQQQLQHENPKGVYMTELMRDNETFQRWIYEFVNYHFRLLICRAKKQRNFNIEIITMKFWFFLINHRHNVINGLYTIKSQIADLQSKSFFLNIIDIAVTRIIENSIKQKDRSLKYSFRKKDMEEAIQFEIFEQFVLSEVIKDQFKVKLMKLLDEKIALMHNMIEGYENLDGMERQMLSLIESSADLERLIKGELRFASTNLHYLKMLSILRIRVQNDPIFASKIEKKIEEIHSKSLAQDVNLIHSLTVLNGNVISIIASFKKEKGKILKYSERAPQFFGYKKAAFDQSVKSVLQLMPTCISVNHDQIIERLIVEGQPKIMRTYRVAIAKDKDGFLFPIKIYVNYYFQINDDFVFSALILKLTSASKFILINNIYQIEGVTKTFLEFFMSIDQSITIDLLEKLPMKLFLPDLSQIIESELTDAKPRIETVKIPMILPEECYEYFCAYKAYLKKMQGSGKSEQQLADAFVRRSKKYFASNILVFEWNLNVTQERFSLLNGFEFTVYLLEVTQIQPIQILANGLMASCPGSVNASSMGKSMSQSQHQEGNFDPSGQQKRASYFEKNESTMFTQQYSQTGLRNRFNFSTTQQSTHFGESLVEGMTNSIYNSPKQVINSKTQLKKSVQPLNQQQPQQNQKHMHSQASPQSNILNGDEMFGSGNGRKGLILSEMDAMQATKEQQPQLHIQIQQSRDEGLGINSGLSMLRTINLDDSIQPLQNHNASMSMMQTPQYHYGILNSNNNLSLNASPMKTDSNQGDDIECMKFTYNDIDAGAADGMSKNIPNEDFPIRIMEINTNQKEDSSMMLKLLGNTQSNSNNNISLSNTNNTPSTPIANPSPILSTITPTGKTDNLNGSCQNFTSKTNQEELKKKRMSVINESLNDGGDFDLNHTQINDGYDNDGDADKQERRGLLDKNQKQEQNGKEGQGDRQIQDENEKEIEEENHNVNLGDNQQQNGFFDMFFSGVSKSNGKGLDQKKNLNKTPSGIEKKTQNHNQVGGVGESVFMSRFQMNDKQEKDLSVNLFTYGVENQEREDAGSQNEGNSKKSDSEVENKDSAKRDIRLQLNEKDGERACSVASSQNSQVSTTIQRIYYSASSKKIPFFMGLFFQVIGFQLFFFGTICVIVSLIFNSSYNGLLELSNELNFSSKVLSPYAQNALIATTFAMQYSSCMNFTNEYLDLNREIQSNSLDSMQLEMYALIKQQVLYDFQKEYLETILNMNFASNRTHSEANVYFFESIKIIFANIFFIHAINPVKTFNWKFSFLNKDNLRREKQSTKYKQMEQIDIGSDQLYMIERNYISIDDIVSEKVGVGVDGAIAELQSSMESINSKAISLSCTLLFLCFVLLAYPFWRYSQYVKGVLLSVSRMTEKEAEEEIVFCKFIGSLLKASDEKYLSIKYTNFELNSISQDEFALSAAQFNTLNKRSNPSKNSKKNYMLSQRINQPRIRLLHFATFFSALFLFSITIFTSAYILINSFNGSLSPCVTAYQHFIAAEQKYASFMYSTDLLFMQRVLSIVNSQMNTERGILDSDFIQIVKEKRTNDLESFSLFFESEFLVLTEKSVFTSGSNADISSVQKENLCTRHDIFSDRQISICSSLPTMQQGLKAVMSAISNEIGMKFIDVWSNEMILAHIASGEYERQMKMAHLTFIALKFLETRMLTDIREMIYKYNNNIFIMYLLGGIFYTAAFIAVCRSVYRNIYRRFFLIKKTVHLVPYKRLQEDQTTINLLRNALEQ